MVERTPEREIPDEARYACYLYLSGTPADQEVVRILQGEGVQFYAGPYPPEDRGSINQVPTLMDPGGTSWRGAEKIALYAEFHKNYVECLESIPDRPASFADTD